MPKLRVSVLTCNRCGHEWIVRSAKIPGTCPNKKCRSPYWNKERVRLQK